MSNICDNINKLARFREGIRAHRRTVEMAASELAAQGWRAETVRRGRGQGLTLIGPDGQRIGADQIDRQATLARINKRLDPPPMSSTAAPAQQGQRPGIGHRQAPVSARTGKAPVLAKPLDKLTGKKGKGKCGSEKAAKDKTTAAMETTVRLIGQLATGTSGTLIGGKRRGGGGRSGLLGKTMRPGGRGFGL